MNRKKTILVLCDHPMSTSGVGTQARWLLTGLANTGKYSFRCFGAAIRHENYDTLSFSPDIIIKPTDGFGDRNLLRQALVQIKPDAVFLFTDPRFFIWVWEMEDEIKKVCPIVYWHLWDNKPWPDFNKVLYESTDLINCINWPTYEMLKEKFPEKTNYIPHAVPKDLYKPLPQDEIIRFKKKLLGEKKLDHFVVGYVGRNARRKMTSDILVSWKMFLDELLSKHGHQKATLVMHTDPFDVEGANLHHVTEMLEITNSVVFSKDRVKFEDMAYLYNSFDTIVNRSCAEGFGLPILEAKMCGKPVIAIKTGGLTRQVEDHLTGKQYGVALEPEVKSMAGNQAIPYIYEDFVSYESVANAIMQMFDLGPDGRHKLGKDAMEHAHREYDIEKMILDWDITLTKKINEWKEQKPQQWEHLEF